MYIIRNIQTKESWSPSGISNETLHCFNNLLDANEKIKMLGAAWQPVKLAFFGLSENMHFGLGPVEKLAYEAPVGSLASKIKFGLREHFLGCGEVQIGKLNEKLELILLLQQLGFPVLMLFRNSNVDWHQFMKRLDEFNDEQRKKCKPTISHPVDILLHKNRLVELMKEPSVILGLANPETIAIVDRCMENNPNLQGKLVVIVDEADLVTFDLECKELRTKTEENLLSLFNKIYMLVSITGTPGSILLCDKETQVYVIDRPDNYYGIDRIKHVSVQPVRAKKKYQQYSPELDSDNLNMIMEDVLAEPKATLLILVSRLRREHKNVISYLSGEYGHLGPDVVYLELNEKSVKVYNHCGDRIDDISVNTFKGTKVGPIDEAIEKYIDNKYIVIVAGVLAGRGVSFVSKNYTRHLTHQYIADTEDCQLESSMQSIRLLGKYTDNPKLTLYCSDGLYQDLLSQCEDMKRFAAIAMKARANKERMPDLILAQKEYTHRWFAPRKMKGIAFDIAGLSKRKVNNSIYKLTFHAENPLKSSTVTVSGWNSRHDLVNAIITGVPHHYGGKISSDRFVIHCDSMAKDGKYKASWDKLLKYHPEYIGKYVLFEKVSENAAEQFHTRKIR